VIGTPGVSGGSVKDGLTGRVAVGDGVSVGVAVGVNVGTKVRVARAVGVAGDPLNMAMPRNPRITIINSTTVVPITPMITILFIPLPPSECSGPR